MPAGKVNVRRSLLDFPYKRSIACNDIQKNIIVQGNQSGRLGRKARGRNTHTIGVVVHELQSDFIKAALMGMEAIATQLGYVLVITHSQESMEKEVTNVQMLFSQQVDGLIASLSFDTTNLDHFSTFVNSGLPVVFFDRVEKSGGSGMVVIDNAGTGYRATQHLIQQGCRRIAIVTSSLERNVYADRFRGFRHALRDHDIPFSRPLLIVDHIREEAGVAAAKQVLAMKERPDGLFITNDLVAAACMRSLIEAGVRVPDDIAIVGFNNDSICKLTVPTITTVNYPGFEMGRAAALKLLDAVMGNLEQRLIETLVVPAELIVRHSSLKNAHMG